MPGQSVQRKFLYAVNEWALTVRRKLSGLMYLQKIVNRQISTEALSEIASQPPGVATVDVHVHLLLCNS